MKRLFEFEVKNETKLLFEPTFELFNLTGINVFLETIILHLLKDKNKLLVTYFLRNRIVI